MCNCNQGRKNQCFEDGTGANANTKFAIILLILIVVVMAVLGSFDYEEQQKINEISCKDVETLVQYDYNKAYKVFCQKEV